MNRLRRPLYSVLSLLLIIHLGVGARAFAAPSAATTPLTSAQNSKQVEQERLRRVMDPAADIEEFRRELSDYFTELEDAMRLYNEIPSVRQKFGQAGLQTPTIIVEAKQKIATMTPEELAQIRTVYAGFPGWREAPRSINSLIKPALREQVGAQQMAAKQNGKEDITINGVADSCQDGINAGITNTDISIAKAVLIAAQAVAAAIPPVLNIPAVAAVAAAESAVLVLETLKGIKDDCTSLDSSTVQGIVDGAKTQIINNDNSNKDTIVSSLDTKTTTVTNAITNAKTDIVNNDNTNRTTVTIAITNAKNDIVNNDTTNRNVIVANDNTNKTAITTALSNTQTSIVNNDNANKTALLDLLLRLQIEADLAKSGGDDDDDGGGSAVALFLTPTANGGYLDLVQTIVTQTLANIRNAGGSIGSAQTYLNQANAFKTAGKFKDAYKSYRKAYKAAAKLPGDD